MPLLDRGPRCHDSRNRRRAVDSGGHTRRLRVEGRGSRAVGLAVANERKGAGEHPGDRGCQRRRDAAGRGRDRRRARRGAPGCRRGSAAGPGTRSRSGTAAAAVTTAVADASVSIADAGADAASTVADATTATAGTRAAAAGADARTVDRARGRGRAACRRLPDVDVPSGRPDRLHHDDDRVPARAVQGHEERQGGRGEGLPHVRWHRPRRSRPIRGRR